MGVNMISIVLNMNSVLDIVNIVLSMNVDMNIVLNMNIEHECVECWI